MFPIGILVIIAIILLWTCSDLGKEKGKKKASTKESVRLYVPHYMKDDEYQCPVCKTRFWKDYMVCPNCGTRFTGSREDDEEFIEEMELWDEDEE